MLPWKVRVPKPQILSPLVLFKRLIPSTGLLLLKWRHAGQACISANRIHVQAGVYDKFAQMVYERTSQIVVGHGADKSTTMGPVTTPQSLDKIAAQVDDAVSKGGRILHGGKRMDRPGYFFEPTVITNATSEMRMNQEETFGPILALYRFETEDEAVRLANDTSVSSFPFPVVSDFE